MFTPEEIQARASLRPFQPFLLKTSDGEAYTVNHPDLIWIGRRMVHVGILGRRSERFYETDVRIAIMHIAAIEDLPTPPAPANEGDRNGEE